MNLLYEKISNIRKIYIKENVQCSKRLQTTLISLLEKDLEYLYYSQAMDYYVAVDFCELTCFP